MTLFLPTIRSRPRDLSPHLHMITLQHPPSHRRCPKQALSPFLIQLHTNGNADSTRSGEKRPSWTMSSPSVLSHPPPLSVPYRVPRHYTNCVKTWILLPRKDLTPRERENPPHLTRYVFTPYCEIWLRLTPTFDLKQATLPSDCARRAPLGRRSNAAFYCSRTDHSTVVNYGSRRTSRTDMQPTYWPPPLSTE